MQSRVSSFVLIVLALIVFLGLGPITRIISDWWWFQTVGYDLTFLKILGVKTAAGVGIGLLAFLMVMTSTRYALSVIHTAPAVIDFQENPLGAMLARTSPQLISVGLGALAGLVFGMTASHWWQQILLFMHGGPFGYEDPLMGFDASFYVFVLPLLMTLRGSLVGLLVLTGIAAMVVYVAGGAVKIQLVEQDGQLVPSGVSLRPEARRHIASIAATLLAMMAVGFYLQRYAMMYEQGGLFAGPGYADIYGTLPLLLVQAVATAIAAFVAYVGLEKMATGWIVMAASLVLGFSAVSSIYPGLVQRFSVLPNELTRESPQIANHIDATRRAFNLHAVEDLTLSGESSLTVEDIVNNKVTIDNVRLWDHTPLLDTFSQVQEIRTYYSFQHVDNDRYLIDGELRQIMLSPRELVSSSLPAAARTWVNQRMTYTHGYGMALGPVNEVTSEGLPVLFIKDLPPKVSFPDALQIDRPEIYYGETTYTDEGEVFVNTDNSEFDYPEGDQNKYTVYAGKGGVPLGAVGRYLFALRFGSTELLFSSDVSQDTKVLLYRNILQRVQQVAPFLYYDNDPYLVIDGGRQVWIVDAYTASDRFPYARSGENTRFNYMRNSVKVTVDAYDGTVTLYRIDNEDPIAQAWHTAFPDLFADAADLPDGIRSHLRYPQYFFGLQSKLFAIYHMTEHHIFYNREDEWEVPHQDKKEMQPYFTVMKLPGEASEEFILMLPFNPIGKPNLAAWMVARSDGEAYGTLRVYKFPKEKMVYGPSMINARIQQDAQISQDMSLWDEGGSTVERGTMLVIPIEESLIYVQPIYLQADVASIPELKRVIVAYESKIAMKPTLEEALDEIFGRPEHTPSVVRNGTSDALSVNDIAQTAADQWAHANATAASGDWEAFGQALAELGATLESLQDLSAEQEADDEALEETIDAP